MKIFPEIFNTIVDRREYLYELLIQHIVLSAGAVAIILVIGLGTGIGILHRSKLRQGIPGVVNFLYTIPSIAMFGLFIPLVGIGYINTLVVLVICGLLPMIRNTYTGLSEVDPHLLDAAKGMGATPRQVFFRVRWPLVLPTIMSGFRTMVVMTIALAGLLILAIFSNPRRSSRNEIVVATKPAAEQYILGEIVSQLIENRTDIRVKRRFGIGGGTSNIHPAIMAGEIDVYPEYTGTA
ncbi:MAG: ABC transporter permease/substrate-binding protein [Bacteroidales bacterium]